MSLLAVLAVEGAGRILYSWKSGASMKKLLDQAGSNPPAEVARCVDDANRMVFRWEPFVYWRCAPARLATVTVDNSGRRLTWRPPRSAPVDSSRRVACFGGSVMWGIGVRDDATIPSHVARRLAAEGLSTVVENDAQIGWVSTQSTLALALALRSGRVPAVVVFCDGANDMLACFQRPTAGVSVSEGNREAEFRMLQEVRRLRREAFASVAERTALGRLAASIRNRLAPRPSPWPAEWVRSFGPDINDHTVDSLAREVVRAYAGNVRLVQGLGRAYGFRTLFYWQPTLFTKRAMTANESRSLYQLELLGRFCRSAHRAVGESEYLRGLDSFHDLGAMFADEPGDVFFDWCHLLDEPNRRVAEVVSDGVLRELRGAGARAAERGEANALVAGPRSVAIASTGNR